MKVVIEYFEKGEGEMRFAGGWKVTYGDMQASPLTYEEMLGLVVSITMPEVRPCLNWLSPSTS